MTRSRLARGLVLLLVLLASGQLISSHVRTRSDPTEVLFDDTVVHEIRLSVSAN